MTRIAVSHTGSWITPPGVDAVSARLVADGHAVSELAPYARYWEATTRRTLPLFPPFAYDHLVATQPLSPYNQRVEALRAVRADMLLVIGGPATYAAMRDIVAAAALQKDTALERSPLYTEICTTWPPHGDLYAAEALGHFGVSSLADSKLLPGLDPDALLQSTPVQLRYHNEVGGR